MHSTPFYRGRKSGFSEGPQAALEVDVKGWLEERTQFIQAILYSPILPALIKAGDDLSG